MMNDNDRPALSAMIEAAVAAAATIEGVLSVRRRRREAKERRQTTTTRFSHQQRMPFLDPDRQVWDLTPLLPSPD